MLKLTQPIRRFQASQQSTEIMAQLTVPGYATRVEDISGLVQAVADQLIGDFFADLSTRMGKEADLNFQTGGQAPPDWKPLSRKYTMRKKHARFWDYQAGMKARKRYKNSRGPKRQRYNANFGPRLITVIRGLNGLTILGPAKVSLRLTARIATPDTKVEPYRKARTSLYNMEEVVRAAMDPNDRSRMAQFFRKHIYFAERYEGTIRLFSNVKAQPQLNKIVDFVAANGPLDELSARKLIGKRSYHRPLINSYMVYYANVVLPARLSAALNASVSSGPGAALASRTPRTRRRS